MATTVKRGRLMEVLTENENFYFVPFMNEVYQLHLFKFSAKARGHMQQGLELEGKVLKAYMQTASEELTNLVEKQFVPNDTYKPKQDDPASNPPPYLGASPDGMATDKEGNHVVLEVKCTMTGATLDSLAKQHADQLQMQMHLSGAKEAHLIKCDTSSMNAITSMKVNRDDSWWRRLLPNAEKAHELYMKCFEDENEEKCKELLRVCAEKTQAGKKIVGQDTVAKQKARKRKREHRAKNRQMTETLHDLESSKGYM